MANFSCHLKSEPSIKSTSQFISANFDFRAWKWHFENKFIHIWVHPNKCAIKISAHKCSRLTFAFKATKEQTDAYNVNASHLGWVCLKYIVHSYLLQNLDNMPRNWEFENWVGTMFIWSNFLPRDWTAQAAASTYPIQITECPKQVHGWEKTKPSTGKGLKWFKTENKAICCRIRQIKKCRFSRQYDQKEASLQIARMQSKLPWILMYCSSGYSTHH